MDQNGKEVKLTDKGSGKYTLVPCLAGKVTIKADFIAQTVDSVSSQTFRRMPTNMKPPSGRQTRGLPAV